jgi:hypothetical protein
MVVMAVHIVKEASHVLAQGIVQDDERLAAEMGIGLLQHESDATAIDLAFTPGGLREKAGEVGFVGTVEDAASHIG